MKRDDLCSVFDIDLSLLKNSVSEDDWDEDCFLINKWPFMDDSYRSKMYRIDDMPQTCVIDGRYNQLESFYTYDDSYGLNSAYFEKEKKYLAVLSKLWANSLIYVESCCFFQSPHEFIEGELLLKIKSLAPSFKSIIIMDDWEVLKSIFILGLRNETATCGYLTDLKMIVWICGNCLVVYIGDKKQEDFVRTICTTEGLYLYAKGE